MTSRSASRIDAGSIWLRHETVLVLLLVLEVVCFTAAGRRFATADNAFNIVRHSVEIGLLALVLTPVILTGGIDLSVGSTLGLCAVCFGKLCRDAGLPPWLAAIVTLGLGALCGGCNALLITRLRLPPLIVTLGTFSLFRGLAEALTRGVDAFTNFPESFLFLGTGAVGGWPTQAWILLAVAGGVWVMVHRMTFGRSFRAIGFSPEGARYAGLPVGRRLTLVYVLAGTVAGLAALTYTARFGTAKADAGLGYELFAITAVVLGGTSIFGGIGTVHGTLLGVAALAVLNNGLGRVPALMNHASELSGVLTGALLLLALAGAALARRCQDRTVPIPTPPRAAPAGGPGVFRMSDETFLQQFESAVWPAAAWHHREHVKVAYLYLRQYGFDEVLAKMRAGLHALNAAQQVPVAPDRGYHETMTQAWLRLVQWTLSGYGPAASADAFVDQHSHLLEPRALWFFYSGACLMSPAARAGWVEPDLCPLPRRLRELRPGS